MRKKNCYFLLIAFITCSASIFLYAKIKDRHSSFRTTCAFCDVQVLNSQKFYEDELIIALYTHKPIVPSHFLIIPKRHIERLEMLSEEETAHIHEIIRLVNRAALDVFQTSSYLILQKNGREVGQSVPHVHFHFIAKQSGDSSSIKFLIKALIAHLSKPLSVEDMQKTVKKMQSVMQEYSKLASTQHE